jgi:hypothetical protein
LLEARQSASTKAAESDEEGGEEGEEGDPAFKQYLLQHILQTTTSIDEREASRIAEEFRVHHVGIDDFLTQNWSKIFSIKTQTHDTIPWVHFEKAMQATRTDPTPTLPLTIPPNPLSSTDDSQLTSLFSLGPPLNSAFIDWGSKSIEKGL